MTTHEYKLSPCPLCDKPHTLDSLVCSTCRGKSDARESGEAMSDAEDFFEATKDIDKDPPEIVTVTTSRGTFRGYIGGIVIESRHPHASPDFFGYTVRIVGPPEEKPPAHDKQG